MAQFHTFAISNSSTATTTFTITIPSDIGVGEDLYVLAVSRDHTVGTAKYTCTDNDGAGNTWAEQVISSDRKTTLFWKKSTSATAGKTITIAGAVGSSTGGMSAFYGGYEGNPTTDISLQENSSGTESHTGFTPSNEPSFIVFGVTNDSNDIDISSITSANLGSMEPAQWEAESTGGSDCKSTMAGIDDPGGTATGNFTWSQTNGTTDSVAFAIKSGVFVTDSVTVSEFVDIVVNNTRHLSTFDAIAVTDVYFPPSYSFSKQETVITVSENLSIRSIMHIDVNDSITVSELFSVPFAFGEFIQVTENITFYIQTNLSAQENITVTVHCLPNTMEISLYEPITLVEYADFSFYGYQMPMSRPQGSLLYQYEDWGSSAPNTGLTIGGVL